MHICFLMPQGEYYSPVSGGAIATVTMELVRELIGMGHRATVLTPDKGDGFYDTGDVIAISAPHRDEIGAASRALYKLQNAVFGWGLSYYPPYRSSFAQALRGLSPGPDWIVIANDITSPRYAKAAVPRAKALVQFHNEQHNRPRDLQFAIACVDRFVAVSRCTRDWNKRSLAIPLQKFGVLLNGVNPSTFFPRPDFLESTSPARAIFIGRIDPNKGPDIAADAVAALRAEGIEIDLTVAGGTWFYGHNQQDPYLLSLLKKIDAAGGKYLGPVGRKDVPELIREHDIAMVLSRSNEPFGLVVLEAMASGLAVIASDRGGLPEACGGAARLVNPDDFKAVVDNLRELATDPEALRVAKQKSVARAAECTWEKRAGELLEIIGGGRDAAISTDH